MAKNGEQRIIPVILSGGSGTRLWPLSRRLYPKQLLPLAADASMLVETARRVPQAAGFAAPIVISSEEHRFIVAEQLRADGVKPARIVLEPAGRNTAPAVAVAALIAQEHDPDAIILVLPSDHVIADVTGLHAAIAAGRAAVAAGRLVTFGVKPTKPETGYGYIERAEALAAAPGAFAIKRFVEKPDQATAERYIANPSFAWNSGMFLFTARAYLAELKRNHPDIVAGVEAALKAAKTDLDFLRLGGDFVALQAAAIDTAVMEKTQAGAVVPVDIGWSDVGSWDALWEIGDKDPAGNVVVGDAVLEDSENSYIRSDERRTIAALGLKDMVVVVADDAVLVAPRARVQDVKGLVERLKQQGRDIIETHTKVYRPWGCYQSIDVGKRFQVKRITVNPGARLSSQMHHHRAEHWVVVEGTANVSVGEVTRLMQENESIYIPIGAVHRLENPGKVPLHLIEVQSGGYLGEDDIVRFDDDYGRR